MLRCGVCRLGEVPSTYWDMVQQYGAVYQTKPYLEVLRRSGASIRVAVTYEDGRILGGSAVILRSPCGAFCRSASVHYGPVASHVELAPAVLSCVANAFKWRSLIFQITPMPAHSSAFMATFDFAGWSRTDSAYLVWDISPDVSLLTKELPKGKKAAMKRAMREDVRVEDIETPEQVRAFYRLHLLTMSRGECRKAAPLTYYQCLFEVLRPQHLVVGFLALHPATRQPIAAVVLLLGTHGDAIYAAVGHDYEYRQLGASDYLMWKSVQYLKDRGFTQFDLVGLPLGDSPRAQGIRHSKRAWAGSYGTEYPSCTCARYIPGVKLPAMIRKKLLSRFGNGPKHTDHGDDHG